MKIIAILNLKGGTAKSTTARNMSYLLASDYNKRTLVCDLDSSGNLSDMFGMRPKAGDDRGMSRILLSKDTDPCEHIFQTNTELLALAPANDTLKPVDIAIRLDDRSPQQFRLARQLKKVQDQFDYCILDCPPSEDILVLNALACAHEVIIPSTVSQDSLDAAIRVQKLVEEVSDYNPSLNVRGMLMTCVKNNAVDKDGVNIVLPKIPKFRTFIRQSVEVERGRFLNMSLREYMREAKRKPFGPVLDYDNFVAEYLGLRPVHEHVPYHAVEVV